MKMQRQAEELAEVMQNRYYEMLDNIQRASAASQDRWKSELSEAQAERCHVAIVALDATRSAHGRILSVTEDSVLIGLLPAADEESARAAHKMSRMPLTWLVRVSTEAR